MVYLGIAEYLCLECLQQRQRDQEQKEESTQQKMTHGLAQEKTHDEYVNKLQTENDDEWREVDT